MTDNDAARAHPATGGELATGDDIRIAIAAACSLTNPRLSEVEWDDVAAALAHPATAAVEAAAGLREALAEGLHKAMCFAPATLHNRLACERPAVYLNLASEALRHPALAAILATPPPAEGTPEGLDAATLGMAMDNVEAEDMRIGVVGRGRKSERVIAEYDRLTREAAR